MKLQNSNSNVFHRIKLTFLLILLALFVFPLTSQRAYASSYEYQKYTEKSEIPEGAVELTVHDLGMSRPLYSKYYEVYSKDISAELITETESLKYEASSQNDQNGIRFDITEYLKEGSSGSTFGSSLQIQVDNWTDAEARENKSLLFYEIYDKDGNLKSKTLLSSIKPNKDNSNLTTEEAKIGPNWSYNLLSGESVLHFEATDRVYLCVTQKGAVHRYDKVYVWYYEKEEQEVKEAYISKPAMNVSGDSVDFTVENLSQEDKEYHILIRSYENGEIQKQRLYTMPVPIRTDRTKVQIPAKVGDVISIYDEADHYYVEDYELNENIWVGTWGSAQLTPGSDTMPPSPGLSGNTYRQGLRVSTGGNTLRITFSNEYGNIPLEIDSTYIARLVNYGGSQIDASTNTLVTFNGGSSKVSIPAGETLTSDDITFHLEPLDYIAVTTLFGNVPGVITSHTASRSTNHLIEGDYVMDEEFIGSSTTTSWYFLSDIDVLAPSENFAVVCFGDSITDGYGVTINMIQRWSDKLAERLQDNPATRNVSVINKGIGGNSIYGGLGPAGYKRYFRDVIEPSGVKYVIILLGVNDIGYASNDMTDAIISKYKEMVDIAHEHGIKVYGGTITPFEGSGYYSVLHEQIRQQVNEWMLSENTAFDAVIDFSAAIADPANPSRMQAKYANDYLHPNAEGYAKLAEAIDLNLFIEEK